MIEIEKKFVVTEDAKKRIFDNAEFVKTIMFTDVYYDTQDFALTCSDRWLRRRDERMELKIPLPMENYRSRRIDQYRELENDNDIATELGIFMTNSSLCDSLEKNGFISFATITTTREVYKSGDLNIVFDKADFGYNVGEIEMMVESENEMEIAIKNILDYANRIGVTLVSINGKLTEFIKRNDPAHYQKLIDSEVI